MAPRPVLGRTNIVLPVELANYVRELAIRDDRTMSTIVRRALELYQADLDEKKTA
jgi:hypothetical protein